MVYTPMMYGANNMSEQEREARKQRSLLKTEGNGWDVGSAVRFLASDQSRWMTGKSKRSHPGLQWSKYFERWGSIISPAQRRMQSNADAIKCGCNQMRMQSNADATTGVILPVDAGTTAASGIGIKSLHDSTTGGQATATED